VSEREEHVAGDHEEDREGEPVVDERGTRPPIDREEPEPLQHGTGGQHHHDGSADEDGVELLAGIELIDDLGGLPPQGLQPGRLVPCPDIDQRRSRRNWHLPHCRHSSSEMPSENDVAASNPRTDAARAGEAWM
jgi:hypothetical protein